MIPLKDNIPTLRFPIITVALIVINAIVYFGFQHGGLSLPNDQEAKTVKYSEIPYEITHPGKECGLITQETVDTVNSDPRLENDLVIHRGDNVICEKRAGVLDRIGTNPGNDQPAWYLTVLFAMFMHGSLLHIAGNMLFLWIFGNNIEDSMGRLKFVAFYLLGGIAATVAQTAVGPSSTTPNLGASGAIAAVLGAYALLYPRARVITLIFIIIFFTVLELPALFVLGGWFLLQLLDAGTVNVANGGGVAYFAHIGGFLFGLATIKLFATRARDDYVQPRLPVY
ncbi:MAG: rhomboid family intramembrane serine protease [Thermoleophilaceae bacterium]